MSSRLPRKRRSASQWRSITIEATPVALGAERVGALVFRGGPFASLRGHCVRRLPPGLEVLDDGRVVAITDIGDWFSGRLRLSADRRA
ncbi:MAG: hypothetical protein WDM79_03165 [Terricaulis sp.]